MIKFLIILALAAQPISAFSLSFKEDSKFNKKVTFNVSKSAEQFLICRLLSDTNTDSKYSHCNVCDLYAEDINVVSNNQITLSLETISFLSIQGSEDLNSNLVHPASARSPPFRLS